jgi:uncharacterized protein
MKFPVFFLAVWAASAGAAYAQPCSDAWFQEVEAVLQSGDGHGHGPDIGSEEWMSVVEFRLGIRGDPGVPPRGSERWCAYIDELVSGRTDPGNSGPSFSCEAVRPDSIEALVCDDEDLSALDRDLSAVYAQASGMAADDRPPHLKAEQRGWIKGRDDCWKSDNQRACVEEAYVRRIAELQARYRLVPFAGPVFYTCDGNPAKEVVATYFETMPPTLIAEYDDNSSLMFSQPSGSGAKYEGRNEMLWEHQGEAVIRWGYDAPEMQCFKKP